VPCDPDLTPVSDNGAILEREKSWVDAACKRLHSHDAWIVQAWSPRSACRRCADAPVSEASPATTAITLPAPVLGASLHSPAKSAKRGPSGHPYGGMATALSRTGFTREVPCWLTCTSGVLWRLARASAPPPRPLPGALAAHPLRMDGGGNCCDDGLASPGRPAAVAAPSPLPP